MILRLIFSTILFTSLSSFAQEVEVRFGTAVNESTVPFERIQYQDRVSVYGVNDRLNAYLVVGGMIGIDGDAETGKILEGGTLDKTALGLIRRSKSSVVKISASYKDAQGITRRKGMTFTVQ